MDHPPRYFTQVLYPAKRGVRVLTTKKGKRGDDGSVVHEIARCGTPEDAEKVTKALIGMDVIQGVVLPIVLP